VRRELFEAAARMRAGGIELNEKQGKEEEEEEEVLNGGQAMASGGAGEATRA